MKSLIEVTAYPGLDYSRAAQIGRKLIARLGVVGADDAADVAARP
jgi:hypothetical protein